MKIVKEIDQHGAHYTINQIGNRSYRIDMRTPKMDGTGYNIGHVDYVYDTVEAAEEYIRAQEPTDAFVYKYKLIPAYMETSDTEPETFVSLSKSVLVGYSYKPVMLLVPAELHAYVSAAGYFCADGIEPTQHIRIADDGRPYVHISKDGWGSEIPWSKREIVWLGLRDREDTDDLT